MWQGVAVTRLISRATARAVMTKNGATRLRALPAGEQELDVGVRDVERAAGVGVVPLDRRAEGAGKMPPVAQQTWVSFSTIGA